MSVGRLLLWAIVDLVLALVVVVGIATLVVTGHPIDAGVIACVYSFAFASGRRQAQREVGPL